MLVGWLTCPTLSCLRECLLVRWFVQRWAVSWNACWLVGWLVQRWAVSWNACWLVDLSNVELSPGMLVGWLTCPTLSCLRECLLVGWLVQRWAVSGNACWLVDLSNVELSPGMLVGWLTCPTLSCLRECLLVGWLVQRWAVSGEVVAGTETPECGGKDLYSVTTEWFCIKMGSGEKHFHVSLTGRGRVGGAKSQDTVHQPQLFKRKESRSWESNRRPLTSLTSYRWAKPVHSACVRACVRACVCVCVCWKRRQRRIMKCRSTVYLFNQ